VGGVDETASRARDTHPPRHNTRANTSPSRKAPTSGTISGSRADNPAQTGDAAKKPAVAGGVASTDSGVYHLPQLSPAQALLGTPAQKAASPAPASVLFAAEILRARLRQIDEQLSQARKAQDFIDIVKGVTDPDPKRLDVNFQEVVHLVGTEEAEVSKLQ
jgi:hypothetical protein